MTMTPPLSSTNNNIGLVIRNVNNSPGTWSYLSLCDAGLVATVSGAARSKRERVSCLLIVDNSVSRMRCEDNPIGALQELSQAQGGQPTPFYELQAVSGESHCPRFTYEARWAELKAVGEGASKVKTNSPVLISSKYQIYSNRRKKRKRLLLRSC